MSSAPDSHDWIPCHEQNRLYTFGIVCRNQDISGEVDSKALASLTPLGPIISSTRLSSQIGIRTKQFTQRSTFDLFFSLSSVIKTREIYWPYFVTNTRFQVNLHTPWNIAHLLSILDFIEVYTGLYPIMHHFSIRKVEMQTIHAAAVGGPSHDNALKWSFKKKPTSLGKGAHTPDLSRPCSTSSISQKFSPAYPQNELIYWTCWWEWGYLIPSLTGLIKSRRWIIVQEAGTPEYLQFPVSEAYWR